MMRLSSFNFIVCSSPGYAAVGSGLYIFARYFVGSLKQQSLSYGYHHYF